MLKDKPIKKVPVDGSTAAALVGYAMSDLSIIYPITPATTMGELVDVWAADGRKNVFGQVLNVTEMQSEGGAAGALHGALTTGSLSVTFTSSQGLLLMIPNMYKMAGGMLPAVFHVASRLVGGQGLSIFCDHSDVMATRQTGFNIVASSDVQEVFDLGLASHLTAIKTSLPVLHFFDGFRVSHEINSVEPIEMDLMKKLIDRDAIKKFREEALNPNHPTVKGTVQSSEIYFQHLEASNIYYERVPIVFEEYLDKIYEATGRRYHAFDYAGHKEAEHVIVAMGSGVSPVEEYAKKFKDEKVGVIKVRLYRPFSAELLKKVLPKTVKRVTVLDRVKEAGSIGEPLYLDVNAALSGTGIDVINGRYGIAGKEFTPAMVRSVFQNSMSENPKRDFTIGITDDVTYKSLPVGEEIDTIPKGTQQCVFWGIGGDGTVGANKSAIKIISTNTDLYGQGFFVYSAHKSGGVTTSHLRFGPEPIKSAYLISFADYTACSQESYLGKYDVLKSAKKGGKFVLNTQNTSLEALEKALPNSVKKEIAEKELEFYVIDATKIARDIGLGSRTNMIMQGIFFKLSGVLPVDEAISLLKKDVEKNYSRKGRDIVEKNFKAIDMGNEQVKRIFYDKKKWASLVPEVEEVDPNDPPFVRDVMRPLLRLKGNELPVSKLMNRGIMPPGTSKYEKRGISRYVPKWDSSKCIQCNLCSVNCPHAVIRPFILEDPPEGMETIEDDFGDRFRIQISPYDCTGCEVCIGVCPVNALEMTPFEDVKDKESEYWEYVMKVGSKTDNYNRRTLKGSQFYQPLIEFSGACAGCGETPIIKLATQMYGDQMYIANASGCSSVYGGTFPWNPYTTNKNGHGPAWGNSLFEDNAEYGLGMSISVEQQRKKVKDIIEEIIANKEADKDFLDLLQKILDHFEDLDESYELSLELEKRMKNMKFEKGTNLHELWDRLDMVAKKTFLIQGGDGWAYDIGYGGLDHVLASGRNLTLLVLDTEVYSNTGGQASKSTPRAGVAKFAANGKPTPKKDLGMMAMSYGNVYVASVNLGGNPTQAAKALKEAFEYDGVSLVIAYTPCIAHGIKGGLAGHPQHSKEALEKGYSVLYRFNPANAGKKGKKVFTLDSRKPKKGLRDWINEEVRFRSLEDTYPEHARVKFSQLENDIAMRYKKYLAFAKQYE